MESANMPDNGLLAWNLQRGSTCHWLCWLFYSWSSHHGMRDHSWCEVERTGPTPPSAASTSNSRPGDAKQKRRDRIKKAGRKNLPTLFKLKDNIFDSPKTTHHIAKIFSKSVPDRVSAKLSHHTWESMKGRVTSCTATKHRGYRQELPGDTTFRWVGQEMSFASCRAAVRSSFV